MEEFCVEIVCCTRQADAKVCVNCAKHARQREIHGNQL